MILHLHLQHHQQEHLRQHHHVPVYPETNLGRWALWLTIPALALPLCWSVIAPLSGILRAVAVAVALAVPLLVVISLALDAAAIVRLRERSVLSITLGSVLGLIVGAYTIAVVLGPR
ncbi:MAG: hypothetical protein JXA67_17265 [Micromonosporaceae bacterium]|nr:hypothetical protein [Micromonosporaceae bacterium]